MGYADLAAAMIDLGLDEDNPVDADKIARLAQLDDEMSRALDLKLGRSFGEPATSAARVVPAPAWGDTVLILPTPIRSVTGIAITGAQAETVDLDDVRLHLGTLRGDYHAIERIRGSWPAGDGRSAITVTGQWSDDAPGGEVPPEITAAATWLVVEEWRLRQSSPAGEIGPDGLTIRARNPWKFELVRVAIERYAAARPVVGF